MTQPKAKPRARLTNADYVAMTPPENSGPRYQLINGALIEMSGAGDGSPLTPVRVFDANDTLTSDAMPGVTVDLAPIFARIGATH